MPGPTPPDPDLTPPFSGTSYEHDLFFFGLTIAWHVCGCWGKPSFGELLHGATRLVEAIAQGKATVRDSPAEERRDLAASIEELRKRDDEDLKEFVQREQESLPDVEQRHRWQVKRDRFAAVRVLKSLCANIPDDWRKRLGSDQLSEE